ncbi:hypothetical protein BG261_02985 [Floricoccus tropicus]|uniref:HTH cro/C1-type domain-containing protein n=1 Tax=Floricoccus tropicus TaxID=1859473 RepID=A0A1E8GMT9_9LACT|nr:S24 family peptidase [Floricoccus tropicus]OFI49560.1 hypothetical protein BG261_02985 [Floricoccus tropicus]
MNSFKNRLREALDLRGYSQAELSRQTGIGRNSISDYLNGKYEAKQNKLYALAKSLDVDVAWLMGYDVPIEINSIEESSPIVNNSDSSITDDIIEAIDKLSHESKKEVLEFAKLKATEENEVYPAPIQFNNFRKRLDGVVAKSAAGFGYSYDDNEFYSVYTDRNDLPDYDFATFVTGDSMEPAFHDGDVVLCKQSFSTPEGGIFIVDYDGKSFIKQTWTEDNKLILHSLNPKYEDKILPIPPDEYTYWNIAGEVIDSFTPID